MAVVESVARYRWVILALASVAQFSNALAGLSIPPLAPLFQPELGLSKTEVGLFSSMLFVGSWTTYILAGSLTDHFGIRRMLFLGQFGAGTLLLLMAGVSSFPQAVAVMFVVGVACGTVTPGGAKAVMLWFTSGSRATAMGLKQTAVPLAGILTASTLPAVALALGWRAAIAVVGLVIIAGALSAAIFYRDTPQAGGMSGRKSGIRRDLGEVLRNRDLWIVSIIAVLFATAQISVLTYLVLYFVEVVLVPSVPDEHSRLLAAGGYMALLQLGGGVGRIATGVISDRIFNGRRMRMLAMVGALSSLMSMVMGNLAPGSPWWLLAVAVFGYGLCVVGWNGLHLALLTEMLGRRVAGTGVGFSMSLIQFGNVGGPLLFGFLVDSTLSYRPGWFFVSAVAGAGTLIAIFNAKGEGAFSHR